MYNPNNYRTDSSTDDDPETSEDELDDTSALSHDRWKRTAGLPW